jgi:hypothetical protein
MTLRHFLILLLIIGFQGWADEQTVYPRQAVSTVYVAPKDSQADDFTQNILYKVLKVELELAGTKTISAEGRAVEDLFDENGSLQIQRALEVAGLLEADFLIIGQYETRGDFVDIYLSCIHGDSQDVVATASGGGELGLAFDSIVARTAEELVASISGLLAQYQPTETAAGEQKAEGTVADERPTEVQTEQETPESQESRVSETITEQPTDIESGAPRRIELSLGASPFLPVGRVSDYFKIGFMPAISGHYRLFLSGGVLGLGAFAAFNTFDASGAVSESRNRLISLGADLRYVVMTGSPVRLFVRAAGGAAILSISVEEGDWLSKIIAQAQAAVGFQWFFSPALALTLDNSFIIYFEAESPIMGYSPTLLFSVNF